MARIEVVDIAHTYTMRRRDPDADADAFALAPLSHVWEDGGAHALLGPSGCGKTTLLKIISGLLRPRAGRVCFDGREVTHLPPEQRNVAQVFQFPVVYESMSVRDNLAFPLRNRGVDAVTTNRRVAEVAEILELTDLMGCNASHLPADTKQKVSLGRGLVRQDVAAVLLDEPLTVVDPHLKWRLRRKLKEIHQRLRTTLIYVTHDQIEALTFADRVLVMMGGKVLQHGTPQDLFERPAHVFVGHFIGSPGMNFLPCAPAGEGHEVAIGDIRIPVGSAEIVARAAKAARSEPAADANKGRGLELGIRPEFLKLVPAGTSGSVPARVTRIEDLGHHRLVHARLSDRSVIVKIESGGADVADHCGLVFPPAWIRLYAAGCLVG